ncbi:hypothetical protein I5H27_gp068 [Mycobacterium phage DillTech15]|uniref:Uncharacterized protein n=1 Tax=Mycobacterium phage DillTech15 TaxID=2163591 RepID=A0A2S1PB33_9CAUD|nr:hypothetical protein I5H27_gp068 [Mycobacterium phage DillTech15]AWH13770.1 hypothetical protein SEA_DILLTECH15_68 [Mycobacterium phage DillTech15]
MNTSTNREYPSYAGDLALTLDTSGDTAKITVEENGETVTVDLDAETARDLGTRVIAYNGSPSTWTIEPMHFGDVELTVEDGQVFLALPDVTPFDLGEGDIDPAVHDFGQRLIVWAGVNLEVSADA